MPAKAKQIIIILLGLLVVSVLITLSALSQKGALEKSEAKLKEEVKQYIEKEKNLASENKRLQDQLKDAQGSQSKFQKQLAEMDERLSSLSAERDDWKNKVEDLKRARDELIAKLQEKPEAPSVVPPQMIPTESISEAISISPSEEQEKYWGGVLKEKASLELKLNELEAKLSSGSVEVEELKKKNSDLELELGQLKNEKEEIERRIKYSEDLTNTLSVELAREKNDKRYVAERLDKIKEENLSLRAQVKELTASKVAMERNLVKLTSDKDTIEKRLAETETIIQNRIDEVLDIKRSLDKKLEGASSSAGSKKEVELPPIIVSAPSPSSATPQPIGISSVGLNGRVVSINSENNFVIVDVGEDAGVRVGDKLSVYRGSKYIAGLEVIQVRKDISAADIKQKGSRIEVGDAVR